MNYLNDDEYLAETLKILKQKFDGGQGGSPYGNPLLLLDEKTVA